MLTWRRLLVLIEHLPRGSSLARAVHGPAVEWGAAEHLVASIFDAVQIGNWQRANQGAKKANQSKPPKPMPRPGQVEKQQQKRTDTYARLHEQRRRMRARAQQGR